MPLARFIALHDRSEHPEEQEHPPSFAVVLAQGPDGVVLVFNRWRKVWELPGGLVDPGESPRQAVVRELLEEAGCVARELEWLGIVEVDDGRRHFGAVYRGFVPSVPATMSNEEIDGIRSWRPGSAVHPLGDSDRALLEKFGPTVPLPRA